MESFLILTIDTVYGGWYNRTCYRIHQNPNMYGDAVSLVSPETLNQNCSDGAVIELSKPARPGRVKCISSLKQSSGARLKYSLMFDIIMGLWEGIHFEMQRLLWRKVNLATGWYCGGVPRMTKYSYNCGSSSTRVF